MIYDPRDEQANIDVWYEAIQAGRQQDEYSLAAAGLVLTWEMLERMGEAPPQAARLLDAEQRAEFLRMMWGVSQHAEARLQDRYRVALSWLMDLTGMDYEEINGVVWECWRLAGGSSLVEGKEQAR